MKQKICFQKGALHLTYWFWRKNISRPNFKFLLSVLILFVGNHLGYSQYDEEYPTDLYSPTQVTNPSVKNPDVAAFEKVNFVPVSNYTGRANITIPIYEITVGKMTVPISLSYNSSGVKVADIPSSVGSNWALNAGGVLSRSIKGLEDFKIGDQSIPHNYQYYWAGQGWLKYTRKKAGVNVVGANLSDFDDYHPDLFTASAPGLSVKYYHTKASSSGDGGTSPILFGDAKGVIVKEVFGDSEATYFLNKNPKSKKIFGPTNVNVTNINGVKYTFSKPSFSTNKNENSYSYNFESLQLSTMYDPSSGEYIHFHYEKYDYPHFDPHRTGLIYYRDGEDHFSSEPRYTQHLNRHRLKKISWSAGSVRFEYNHQREDGGGDKALTSITVYDRKDNVIKKMVLDYNYFKSKYGIHTVHHRLRLDKVYQVNSKGDALPGYQLFYDTSKEMPSRISYAHDFLGYNNGSYDPNNKNPSPKFYFVNSQYNSSPDLDDKGSITNVKSQPIVPFQIPRALPLGGNYSLEANLDYAKVCSLNKIIYPTGGISEYEYELNEFYYRGTTIKGGGLRIKSQKLIDEYGNEQILDYSYYDGQINNFPSFAKVTKEDCRNQNNNSPGCRSIVYKDGKVTGVKITKYRVPNSQVELTQGAFVGYGTVIVKNRVSNGYTYYQYHTPEKYKNIPSTKSEFLGNGTRLYNLGAGALSANQDIYRGKLIAETVRDKNHIPIKEKRYEYSSSKFGQGISLNFYNQASTKCNRLAGPCEGFKESLTIPIERNLLTKVITKEYSPSYRNTDPRENPSDEITKVFKTETSYHYDDIYPLVVEESRLLLDEECSRGDNSCLAPKEVQKKIKYPSNSNLPFAQTFVDINRLDEPMEISIIENGKRKVKEELFFKDYGSIYNKIIRLEKVNLFGNDSNASFSNEVTKRTNNGKIAELKYKNENFATYLYAYHGHYMIAEINNAQLNQVKSILSENNIDYYRLYEEYNAIKIEKITTLLREKLPNALVTSYTHKPLVGVTSVTDSRGRKQIFEYDSFNRLQMVKDHDGNIINENKYHYKNQ